MAKTLEEFELLLNKTQMHVFEHDFGSFVLTTLIVSQLEARFVMNTITWKNYYY